MCHVVLPRHVSHNSDIVKHEHGRITLQDNDYMLEVLEEYMCQVVPEHASLISDHVVI